MKATNQCDRKTIRVQNLGGRSGRPKKLGVMKGDMGSSPQKQDFFLRAVTYISLGHNNDGDIVKCSIFRRTVLALAVTHRRHCGQPTNGFSPPRESPTTSCTKRPGKRCRKIAYEMTRVGIALQRECCWKQLPPRRVPARTRVILIAP